MGGLSIKTRAVLRSFREAVTLLSGFSMFRDTFFAEHFPSPLE